MKRLFFVIIPLMMSLEVMAQDILGNPITLDYNKLNSIPSFLSSNGNTIMYSCSSVDNGMITGINIYDKDFNTVKIITAPSPLSDEYVEKRRGFVSNYSDTGEFLGEGYTGAWETTETKDYFYPMESYVYFRNYDSGITINVPLTQTLFNDDDSYEYIEYIYKEYTRTEEFDRDFDAVIDEEITLKTYYPVGFQIVQDNGNVLQSVNIDVKEPTLECYDYFHRHSLKLDYDGIDVELCKIYGKNYVIECHNNTVTLYSINNDGGSSGIIHKVGSPIKVSVRPTIVNRNEPISVALDGDNAESSRVTVNDASGRTVYRTTIPAGQKQTNIDTSKFGNGLNVVTVQRNGSKVDSHKVIVK